MRYLRLSSASIVALLVTLWPQLAAACAVCFSADGEARVAFIKTTILLTLMPLVLAGGALWWLRRRMKQRKKYEMGMLGVLDKPSSDA